MVKYNPIIYNLYYYMFSFLLKLLGFFVKLDSKTILFMSFGGRSYSDSPKEIYEKLSKSTNNLKLIWAFVEPENVPDIKDNRKVKIDTFRFFIAALKSAMWVTNSSIERGLKFKKSKTVYFNTWHGTPLKKMGIDISANNQSFDSKAGFNRVDKFTVQSDYEAEIFSRAFDIESNKMFKVGLPRNDELVQGSSKRSIIREQFGFSKSDKIILYTPTFREFEHNSLHQITSSADVLMTDLVKKLPDNYKILSRSHYEVDIINDTTEISSRIFDVSEYPDLNELIYASDMLISDYSSVIFDYSLTEKPIFIFSYDYPEYSRLRGMYFNIENELLSARTIDNLSKEIINSEVLSSNKVKIFKGKYLNYYGNATEQSVRYILRKVGDQ